MIAAALMMLAAASADGKAVKDKPAVTLDPAQAYVFFRAGKGGQALRLYRLPETDDLADYEQRRGEAFAKAHRKWEGKVKSWERDTKALADARKAKSTLPPDPGPRPIEPTDATFALPPIELEGMVAIGPLNRFAKTEEASSYLHAVKPGTYVVYGPIMEGQQGAFAGTCLCMGTVKFAAGAGVVTDLGTTGSGPMASGSVPDMGELAASFALTPADPGKTTDPRIASVPTVPARYLPAGKMANWYGVLIDRLTPIAGVFRYERDRMIDLTGNAAAAGN